MSNTTNEAKTIYSKLGIQINQQTVVTIGDIKFVFYLDTAAYDAMQNEITAKNKITPIKDYLLAIVSPEKRQELAEILQIPGVAVELAEAVNSKLIPKIEIKIKN